MDRGHGRVLSGMMSPVKKAPGSEQREGQMREMVTMFCTGEYGCNQTAIGAQKKIAGNHLTGIGVLSKVVSDGNVRG